VIGGIVISRPASYVAGARLCKLRTEGSCRDMGGESRRMPILKLFGKLPEVA
jgi:hypothetical protein